MMQREWSELGFRFCGAEPGRITLLLFKFLLSTKIKSIKLKMNLTRTVTVTINLCNSSGRWHQRQRGSTFVRIPRRAIWWATANQNHPTVRGVSQFDPGDIFLHNKVAGVIITPVSDCSRPLLCKLIDAFRRHFVCSNNSWIFISLIKHLRNVQGCKLLMKWGRFTWNTLLKFVFVSFVSTFSSWRFSFCRYLLKLLSHNCSCWCDHSYYETHFLNTPVCAEATAMLLLCEKVKNVCLNWQKSHVYLAKWLNSRGIKNWRPEKLLFLRWGRMGCSRRGVASPLHGERVLCARTRRSFLRSVKVKWKWCL